jgi:DNA-binding NtrC family response regulator
MTESTKALFVQVGHEPFDELRLALDEQSIGISVAKNCAEAALALWAYDPPHMVFTEVQLSDGNWTDVLTLATSAPAPVNVIVVARFADVGLYVQTIERGVFDFIVPPHSKAELLHVVRTAAENSRRRRRKHLAGLLPRSASAASQAGRV